MLLRTQLSISTWSHAKLHTTTLIRLRLDTYFMYSPLQLITENKQDISHLETFDFVVYVSITPPQRKKI